MTINLKDYQADAHFNYLDWEFGLFLARRGNIPQQDDDHDAVTLLGAKCLQVITQGHTCLDLRKWLGLPTNVEDAPLPSPLKPDEWCDIISKHPEIILTIDQQTNDNSHPLLFDKQHQLVYLNKYHHAEIEIATFLHKRLKARELSLNAKALKTTIHELNSFFASTPLEEVDPQQEAVIMALTHNFAILTGGPGTGKTTALATILAMEIEMNPNIRIGLAAPTGKAAMQVLDSLNEELSLHLKTEKLSNGVEEKLRALTCSTIHRMLGMHGDGARPFFNKSNPLSYDLVVIDESSMVSLRLMQLLCRAIPDGCRLLLVGDQNQLAAVDAGCLLGDFCSRSRLFEYKPQTPPDQRYITRLVENHRSRNNPSLQAFLKRINETTGIHERVSDKMQAEIDLLYKGSNPQFRASEMTLTGKRQECLDTLTAQLKKEVEWMLAHSQLPKQFADFFGHEKTDSLKLSLKHWKELRHSDEDTEVLNLALAHFYVESLRIICGIHDGMFGEINLNQLMSKITEKNMGDDGFPIIILKNDSILKLYNGDIGICWNNKAYFPKWKRNANKLEFDCTKVFSILQLPPSSTAFAMTIHKSQGSGFDNVIMALPPTDNNVLCRELVYTGISRTKRNFLLWSPREIFCSSIDRECNRWSGMPLLLEK